MRDGALRRGRARAPARPPRPDEPLLRALHQDDHQAVADVPDRRALRPRLRHRHRGRAAVPRRRRGAGAGLPFYAILCLPILFAAGMSLLDTIDGCFMNFAYGWAFSKPVRKIFYNITITGAVGRRRARHRHDRARSACSPTSSSCTGRSGTGSSTSTSTPSASSSSACSSSPGRSRSRSGTSARIEERWTAHVRGT